MSDGKRAEATFGGGCFWCTEAVFQRLEGVLEVVAGYAGGHVENPTYEQVCNKDTGHAEVIRVVYDPERITYVQLLEVFFRTHDPTTRNRQGNDVGPQYRSVVFHHDEEQRRRAEEAIERLNESGAYSSPIVTEVAPLENFHPAESYHQDYFERNASQPYCQVVIAPKLDKFEQAFSSLLKAR